MYLLIIQLYHAEYKDDVLLALTSCGIQKGGLFEGTNLDQELTRDFPLFTGLVRSDEEKARFALQITAVVDEKRKVHALIDLLKEADIDIEGEGILRMMLLPLDLFVDEGERWER